MKSVLTAQEKARLQVALAEAFVDNDVDYAAIARCIQGFDLLTVKDILYSQVAPACFGNLETPIPPVWAGFRDDWLFDEIEKSLKARNDSWLRRNLHHLLVAWLRYSYGYIWKEIMKAYDQQTAGR
ncbi:hypothetical protein [Pseudomonas purpurea]|uniref:DUF7079 family protein n=1 Tax=Pseudomonas purpurea TaxID=3136737 RepID=UPI003263C1C4